MKKLAVLIVIFVLLLSLIPTGSVAFADEQVYSDALADLQKDPNFDSSAYPVDLSNDSIDIITLARGAYDELYVYTYQPAIQRAFYCSSINISRHNPDDREATVSYDNYRLSFCNNNGVFFKYIVEGFTVLNEDTRYYCISQIMRPFDSSIDEQPGNGQTISEVPIKNNGSPVSKEYVFHDANGHTQVECKNLDVIEITSKFVGYVRYYDGGVFDFGVFPTHTDSHFVAFSTDRNIDELYDADVKWSYRTYTGRYVGCDPDMNDVTFEQDEPLVSDITSLYADVVHEQESNRIFAHHYSFKEIQTVDELLAEEVAELIYDGRVVEISQSTSFDNEARMALEDQQWVLRFTSTSFSEAYFPYTASINVSGTRISDVIILRLHFKSQGQEYDLGVVDNKQTGSANPIGQTKTEVDFADDVKKWLLILLVVLGVIALCVLLNFLKPIFKAIWWVITLPFKLFRKLLGLGQEAHPQSTEQPQRKPRKYRYRR